MTSDSMGVLKRLQPAITRSFLPDDRLALNATYDTGTVNLGSTDIPEDPREVRAEVATLLVGVAATFEGDPENYVRDRLTPIHTRLNILKDAQINDEPVLEEIVLNQIETIGTFIDHFNAGEIENYDNRLKSLKYNSFWIAMDIRDKLRLESLQSELNPDEHQSLLFSPHSEDRRGDFTSEKEGGFPWVRGSLGAILAAVAINEARLVTEKGLDYPDYIMERSQNAVDWMKSLRGTEGQEASAPNEWHMSATFKHEPGGIA